MSALRLFRGLGGLLGATLMLHGADLPPATGDLKGQLLKASQLQGDRERLAAYDSLAASLGPNSSRPKTESAGRWVIAPNRSPMYDWAGVTATLVADDLVETKSGSGLPTLQLSCDHTGEVSVVAHFGVFLATDKAPTSIRFGTAEATRRSLLPVSQDYEGVVLAFGGEEAFKLMEAFSKVEATFIQVSPSGDQPVVATFKTVGIEKAISAVKAAVAKADARRPRS